MKTDWLSRKKGEWKWLLVEADVRGVGTCDEPLRTFAWQASSLLVQEDQSKQDKKTENERVEFHKAKRRKKVCFDFKLLILAGQGG